jgi:hypothetical protein
LEKCTVSLVTREMEIKSTVRYHLLPKSIIMKIIIITRQ